MKKKNETTFTGGIVKLFFYIAPLLGIIYGVYYLQNKNNGFDDDFSIQEVEQIIIKIVNETDKKNCLSKKDLKKNIDNYFYKKTKQNVKN